MELARVINREHCFVLKEKTKTEAIIELVNSLEGYVDPTLKNGPIDIEELKKELFYREQLMSTGLGLGIGVPHVRFSGVSAPIVIAAVQPEGISDYESLDGKPVNIIIMIIVGEHQHKQHIRLLSMIAARLKDNDLKQALLTADDGTQIYRLLTGSEVLEEL